MNKLPHTHRTVLNCAKTLNAVFTADLFCSADGFLGLGAISAGTQVCKAVRLAESTLFFFFLLEMPDVGSWSALLF